MRKYIFLSAFICLSIGLMGQSSKSYWNSNIPLNSYRIPPAPAGTKIKFTDLDKDGDPDVLETLTINNTPIRWIDDDDDMKWTDKEGDTDNDCLMVDRDKDGHFGSYNDLVIDWNDTNKDGKADMQVVVDYVARDNKSAWGPGHYMWVLDTDLDNIFNYIDWNTFQLRCWVHNGQSDFFEDYHGKSMFLKMHTTTDKMNDVRLNWENPFLFYDQDNDGLTEMAIRLCDSPPIVNDRTLPNTPENMKLSGNIDWASLSFDLDNDNGVQNEFDLDMTIHFRGGGFNYMDQVHQFNNMRGLPATDTMFLDPRWRQISELIYPDHQSAWDLVFKRGKWKSVYFTFDEDDDCNRWERVELYEPKNMFAIGARKGGIDNNAQADAAGDRGEWDMDNSGKGNLYVGKFDGRIHLYGAEWGCWRIDQNAFSYQGFGGLYDGYGSGRIQVEPKVFSTLKYSDTDNNGFLDEVSYDLNGDTIFEHTVSLKKFGIDDRNEVINTAGMSYKDLVALNTGVAERMWTNALEACAIAEKAGINLSWYSLMRSPKSIQQKYSYGYWLQLYLYHDLMELGVGQQNKDFLDRLDKAYFGGNWKGIGKLGIL
ncbi:MAG: hypothetical protein WCP85_16015 [Mariniphaga sp.]